MNSPTSIGICTQCKSPFEFDTSMAGQTAECPTCGATTVLYPGPLETQPSTDRKKGFLESIGVDSDWSHFTLTDWVVFLSIAIPAALVILGALVSQSRPSPSGRTQGEFAAYFVVFEILGGLLYFLPALVGRKKRNSTAILVLNFFL